MLVCQPELVWPSRSPHPALLRQLATTVCRSRPGRHPGQAAHRRLFR
jgi:hypothetical protein